MIAANLALLLSRQYTRNTLLLVLFLIVPFLFITLSYYTTESVELEFFVREGGERTAIVEEMPDVHGAIMVPITAAFLAGMGGLFVMLEAGRAGCTLGEICAVYREELGEYRDPGGF